MLEAAFTITDWLDMVGLYFVMSYLRDLQLVTLVRTLIIVGETLGAHEVVVGRGRGDDVSVTGDLTSESFDGTSHCLPTHYSATCTKSIVLRRLLYLGRSR